MGKYLLAGAVVFLIGCSREGEGVVAVVGERKIRAHEFRDRYKKFLDATGVRDNIVQRKSVLQNMINEQLIIDHLRHRGWFDRPEVKKRLEEIRLQALLDRYAVKHIADTVEVTEKEIQEEFRNSNAKVNARYLYARSEQEAWRLRQKIDRGATFEELAKSVFEDPGLANNGGNLGYFGRGEMDEQLEDVAFSLPKGGISNPVKIGIGYAIVKVEDRVDHPLLSEYDYARQKSALVDRLRKKKGLQALDATVGSIAEGLSARFNDYALQSLMAQWEKVTTMPSTDELEKFHASAHQDILLVEFRHDRWTVGDFLKRLEYTSGKQRARVKNIDDLRKVILGLAAREILIARAEQSGCGDDVETRMQRDNVTLRYILTHWEQMAEAEAMQAEISETAIREIYEKNKHEFLVPPEVNVAEILVRTKEEAEALRRRIDRGEDFRGLAQKYSIRTWAAKRGGELGFETIQEFGILGPKFMNAPINTYIGPEYVDPYYGVFKILGKKPARQKEYSECRGSIIEQLRAQKKIEVLRKSLATLRAGAQISIDEVALANIHVPTEGRKPT
jgi:parvulin-like peptidyl-prolyl isomerase